MSPRVELILGFALFFIALSLGHAVVQWAF